MTHTHRTPVKQWTIKRAAILAAVCLLAGIAGGWSIRTARTISKNPASSESAAGLSAAAAKPAGTASQGADLAQPDPAQWKEMADKQAAPLVDRLKSAPRNPDLLAGIGNVYYDAQQYPIAVDYYRQALQARPSDAAVRTDMGTAYWYMGDADMAIAEFNQALFYAPYNPNTLFNLGLVKWQGKKDAAGAIADWKKLLATDPAYEQKGKVEEMLAEAQKSLPPKAATEAK